MANRAKSLVKKWRELLLPPTQNRTPPIPTTGEPPPGGGVNGGVSRKPMVNGNGTNQSSYNSRPSSRLTSPATGIAGGHLHNKSNLSPGLRAGGGGGISSSLPSSTSTSPGLSRPTTPNNKHTSPTNSISSHPASPTTMPPSQQPGPYGGESVPRHNAANKRLRKDIERGDQAGRKVSPSLFDLTNDSSYMSGQIPPPAKRSRLNGIVSNNPTTSEFVLKQSNRDITNHRTTTLSSPPLRNCDISSNSNNTRMPVNSSSNRFANVVQQHQQESSHTSSTPSVSPQASSLSPPPVVSLEATPSSKPPPGKRKTRAQRRSEDEQQREDILKLQMQSATRSGVLSKVRTTQELVQELTHSRLTSPSLTTTTNNKIISHNHVVDTVTQLNETKTELMNRFFDSQNNHHSDNNADTVLSPPDSDTGGVPSPDILVNNHSHQSSRSASRSESATPIDNGVGLSVSDNGGKETVEDVMARLPPIDAAAILAELEKESLLEEQDEDVDGLIPIKKPEIEITEEMVDRLNSSKVESFNGNFGHDGEFKEWHEVVSKTSAEGDLLHILPYSVID